MLLATLALLSCMVAAPAFSQVNLGRIGGTITDQTGGAIVGATVTVTDVARGVSRNLTTDAAGVYSAPNLIPGTYTVHAEFKGFQSVDRQDVLVEVGQDVRMDLSLQPGEQTQTVTVTGEQAEVNTTNAQLGGTITNQTATDLPIAGRTFLYLLNYRPGLETKPGAGGGLIQYSNGMRPDYNIYVFDGLADVNSYGTAGPLNIGFQAGGPDESVILSVDAVQEMNLVENPKAEYGWRPGAQIDIGLKSGTNAIHGTAFALGRDTSMDTVNPFTHQVAPTIFEQFGATIGGPIKKNKVFYYLGYEAQRYNVGNPKNITVPTLAAGPGPANSFPDAIKDMMTPNANHGVVTPNPLSLNLAGCTLGAAPPATVTCTPNAGLFSNNRTGSAATAFPTDFADNGGSDNGSAKIDYHINDKNSVNLDFFRGIGYVNAPVGNVTQPYWASNILGSVTVGRVVWAWVPSSNWVNEVRAGWDYSLQTANPGADCVTNPNHPNYNALGYVSGAQICGIAAITISGFGSYPASPTMGQPEGIWAKSLNYRVSDNLSYTSGNHNFKFGAEIVHQIFDGENNEYLSKGALAFGTSATTGVAFTGASPLEDFLNGVPSAEQIQTGNFHRTVTFQQFTAYAEDDWRVKPRLTLNLGLRYEYETPISEANNLIGNFAPGTPTGLVQANGGNLYRGYPWMFEPRFGVAWDVTGKGTTVVHTGFNISYYLPTVAEFFSPTTLQNMPTAFNLISPSGTRNAGGTINLGNVSVATPAKWNVNTPIFSSLVGQTAACSNTGPCKIAGVGPNLTDAEFFLWNVGVQHAFSNSLTLDVSYVGNHGEHMLDPVDINQPLPGTNNGAQENARRPYAAEYPYFSNIDLLSGWQQSNYDGLQATLNERVSHGLTFTAGYTYSHAFDMAPGEIQEVVPQDSTNRNAEYGSGVLDVRHRFTLEGTYALPGKKSPAQMLEGWVVSSATQLWSALPYGPIDSTDDISGTGEAQDRWDMFGPASAFDGYGRETAIPCYGVTGSTFAKVARCTPVTNVTLMPQACQTAAASLPVNSSLPAGTAGATGTLQLARLGCYMAGNSVIVPPAQGTFGTMQRDALRGQGFRVWDMTIMKNWVIKERVITQFRVEFYNLLNSTQFAQLSATVGGNLASPASFGASTGTPNVLSNSPIIGNGDTRRIQLGLRFQF